jgi:hypothetical protein
MALHSYEKGSQLFTLRVWPEETNEGHAEWRGKIQRVVSGETLYFHDWQAMMSFLLATLDIAADVPAAGKDNPRRRSDE